MGRGKSFARVSSLGDAYDHAMVEILFGSLECEPVDRRGWKSFAEARMAFFTRDRGLTAPPVPQAQRPFQKSPINFKKELHGEPTAVGTVCRRVTLGRPTENLGRTCP